jgi:signal transduction histidine kinase/CheY-like chemotaxis protein
MKKNLDLNSLIGSSTRVVALLLFSLLTSLVFLSPTPIALSIWGQAFIFAVLITSVLSLSACLLAPLFTKTFQFSFSKKRTVDFRHVQTSEFYQGFVQTISDDIRAPLLTIVSGLNELLLKATEQTPALELKRLYDLGTRLQGRLNNALELGRSSPTRRPESRPVDLAQIAIDLAEAYAQPLASRPQILLNVLVDQRLPQLIGAEPRRLMMLLTNLVDNSLRYSTKGQITVRIVASSLDKRVGEVIGIELSCSDSGCGISAPRLKKISEELKNYTNLSNGNQSEIGLGLRTAVAVVAEHKGAITISSEQGKGTTVTASMSFPVLAETRDWTGLPKSFRFSSTIEQTCLALGNAAAFHRISAIQTSKPALEVAADAVFVEGSELIRAKWGAITLFQPRDRFIIILRSYQHRLRDSFLEMGFSRFVTLPIASSTLLQLLAEEDTPIARQHVENSSNMKRILVVDDSETNRLRICYHLRGNGYHVIEACDGLEMVSLIKAEQEFDLILTDLTMVHLNGEEAVQQVREYENTRGLRTPIVAISAYADGNSELMNKQLFDALLKKPVYLDELDFLVSGLIKKTEKKKMTETKFINLEELKSRTAGKTNLMSIVLDSFIQSSKGQLAQLSPAAESGDKALLVRTLHTLNGLLLEAGAGDCATKLRNLEHEAKSDQAISPERINSVKKLVADVASEAAVLRDKL